MHYRNRLGRSGILVLVIVGLTAASAAAARWVPWAPLNSCLFCGTPNAPGELAAVRAEREAGGTVAMRGSAGRPGVAGAIADRARPQIPPAPQNGVGQNAASADSRHEWQPWGTGSAFHTGGTAESTPSLGGLSRLMSMSISGGGSSVNTPPASQSPEFLPGEAEKLSATSPPPPSAPPSEPGPVPPSERNGTPAPIPPGPGGYTPPTRPTGDLSPTPPATPRGSPDPTDPFHEHDTPPPAPFVPPRPDGPLDTNGPTATLPTGGSPSPNPEPGSILLLGTGVIAVLGVLRRRRVL